jgi:glycosyltransferase involved in cell wall biosynthesis
MRAASVSVIIPAYRAASVLGRAVASVLAQTCPVAEILVVDDGSPDDVAAVLTPFADRVRLLRQANGGASSARNHGLDEATGEMIAFLDADDVWEPSRIERQLEVMRRHPEVGLTASRFYEQLPGQPRVQPRQTGPEWYDRVLTARGQETLLLARRVLTSTVLLRRSHVDGERFDTTLRTAEDIDLWIRLLRKTSAYLSWEPLITMVQESGSLSRSDVDNDCSNMLRVVRRHADLLSPGQRRSWEASVYREWAACHLGAGKARRALAPAWQRWRREWWSPQACWILVKALARSTGTRPRRGGAEKGKLPVASAPVAVASSVSEDVP